MEKVKKMNMLEFIVFILELTDEELYEKLTNTNAQTFYLTGHGSLELARILKKYYNEGKIVRQKGNFHFAFDYNNEVYDATGVVEDKENYIEATQNDINYTEDRLKFHEFVTNNENVSERIINEIPKCNILHRL